MFVLGRLARSLRRHVRRVSWGVLFSTLLLLMSVSWVVLAALGEDKLTAWQSFAYWFATTATTIGYGDLSPSTTAGRFFVGLIVMPCSVAIFAAVLAKSSAALLNYWKRHTMGKMSYLDLDGHTVLVGWRGADTVRLVNLLHSDTATDDEGIVLVAEGLAENPLVDEQVRFVAVQSYADTAGYARCSIASAGRIIVHTASDDQTLAAVMAIKANKPTCHVVAHFDGVAAANLVKAHYPNVECVRPMTAEIIARAAQDPGSSLVLTDVLSSSDSGCTQFSLQVPEGSGPRTFGSLVEPFHLSGAILLGVRAENADAPQINPSAGTTVRAGDTLYYLHSRRLSASQFFKLATAAEAVPA